MEIIDYMSINKIPIQYQHIPNTIWNLCILSFKLNTDEKTKKYIVYKTTHSNKTYIKPYKPYYEFEFEKIFNFKYNCQDYNKEKIRLII